VSRWRVTVVNKSEAAALALLRKLFDLQMGMMQRSSSRWSITKIARRHPDQPTWRPQ